MSLGKNLKQQRMQPVSTTIVSVRQEAPKVAPPRVLARVPPKTPVVAAVPEDDSILLGSVTDLLRDGATYRRMEADEPYLRPSSFGGCPRSQMFFYMKAPTTEPPIDFGFGAILDAGTAQHRMLQGYLADHPGVYFAPEVRVRTKVKGIVVKGSADGALITRRSLIVQPVEFKTTGSAKFAKLDGVHPDHAAQATIYCHLLNATSMRFVYMNRDSFALKEYTHQYNPDQWEELVERRVDEVKHHTAKRSLPVFNQDVCDYSLALCRYRVVCSQNGGAPREPGDTKAAANMVKGWGRPKE